VLTNNLEFQITDDHLLLKCFPFIIQSFIFKPAFHFSTMERAAALRNVETLHGFQQPLLVLLASHQGDVITPSGPWPISVDPYCTKSWPFAAYGECGTN